MVIKKLNGIIWFGEMNNLFFFKFYIYEFIKKNRFVFINFLCVGV